MTFHVNLKNINFVEIMLWNSGVTSGHRETKASWPLPTVTQAMSQNKLIMICFTKRPTAETKPSLSPVSLPKGSPASTPGKYTRCGFGKCVKSFLIVDQSTGKRG